VIGLAMTIAITGVAQSVSPRSVSMKDLTVPEDRLPAGCILSPTDTVHLDGNRVRGGSWAGLPIPTNPWTGADRPIVAAIRERMHEGQLLVPDGPPLDRRAASRDRLLLADGVEEAYAAIYVKQPQPALIVVYAARFAATKRPFYPPGTASNHRIEIGPIDALVSGDGGQCSHAVEAYLKSLAN
jgi:hypothetical protein